MDVLIFAVRVTLDRNDQLSMSNGKSEAQKSCSDALLLLSAVVNEGKGTVALTEMTSAKNKTAISVNVAVSPVRKMLDKAECDQYSVSHLLSPVIMRKEGEREKSLYEPDFMTTDRPVAQIHVDFCDCFTQLARPRH
jgi:hypothetical protein